MTSKKKVLGVVLNLTPDIKAEFETYTRPGLPKKDHLKSQGAIRPLFQTYTRYYRVDDEKKIRSQGILMRNLIGVGYFNCYLFKRGLMKKKFGNPVLDTFYKFSIKHNN